MALIKGGTFNGTASTVYICFGFVPDEFYFGSAEDSEAAHAYWNKYMAANDMAEGWMKHAAQVHTLYTPGTGIRPYEGGDTLTSTTAGTTTYGEGVYLKEDTRDYRYGTGTNNTGPGGYSGDAVATTIDTWTLDTSSTTAPKGHFNEDVNGTYVGEGSHICIDGLWYMICALTATEGESTDEVTLNYAAPSGDVTFISGKYGYKPMVSGETTLPGVCIRATTDVNVNDETQWFRATKFDN